MNLQKHNRNLQPPRTHPNRSSESGSKAIPKLPQDQEPRHLMTSLEGQPLARPHQVQSSRTFFEESPGPILLETRVRSIFHQTISVHRTDMLGSVKT